MQRDMHVSIIHMCIYMYISIYICFHIYIRTAADMVSSVFIFICTYIKNMCHVSYMYTYVNMHQLSESKVRLLSDLAVSHVSLTNWFSWQKQRILCKFNAAGVYVSWRPSQGSSWMHHYYIYIPFYAARSMPQNPVHQYTVSFLLCFPLTRFHKTEYSVHKSSKRSVQIHETCWYSSCGCTELHHNLCIISQTSLEFIIYAWSFIPRGDRALRGQVLRSKVGTC